MRKIPATPFLDPFGSFNWKQWFKALWGESQVTCGLYRDSGVPNNALGDDGDYYFRTDAGASTHIYYKSGGTWAAIL